MVLGHEMKNSEMTTKKFGKEIPTSKISSDIYSIGPLGNPKVITLYLIDGKRPTLIDSGPSSVSGEVVLGLKKLGFVPTDIEYIALTHIHIDHGGGAWLLSQKLPNSTVLIPKRGFKFLIEPSRLIESANKILGDILDSWGPVRPLDQNRSTSVEDNEVRELGARNLRYIWAPGHASHHMVLYDAERREVFAADAVGIYHPEIMKISPTTPPPGFDYETAIRDIKKIESWNPKRLYLPHFQHIEGNSEFFDMVKRTYNDWFRIILREFRNGLSNEKIMEKIENEFPEYRAIGSTLLKQLTRVDVGGYLYYFKRKKGG
jgi:glyoxylase-like metal-dependent hydrolase (beta-lactamase superfamily II)